MGETSTESKLIQERIGSTQYDTEGLDQSEIDAAVAEKNLYSTEW